VVRACRLRCGHRHRHGRSAADRGARAGRLDVPGIPAHGGRRDRGSAAGPAARSRARGAPQASHDDRGRPGTRAAPRIGPSRACGRSAHRRPAAGRRRGDGPRRDGLRRRLGRASEESRAPRAAHRGAGQARGDVLDAQHPGSGSRRRDRAAAGGDGDAARAGGRARGLRAGDPCDPHARARPSGPRSASTVPGRGLRRIHRRRSAPRPATAAGERDPVRGFRRLDGSARAGAPAPRARPPALAVRARPRAAVPGRGRRILVGPAGDGAPGTAPHAGLVRSPAGTARAGPAVPPGRHTGPGPLRRGDDAHAPGRRRVPPGVLRPADGGDRGRRHDPREHGVQPRRTRRRTGVRPGRRDLRDLLRGARRPAGRCAGADRLGTRAALARFGATLLDRLSPSSRRP